MKLVCDLEVHSKYARAVSKFMVVPEMALWAARKGIDILGTGDFTHPAWLAELKADLIEDGTGLLKLKAQPDSKLRFMLTGEVSLIYSKFGRGRRVHIIVLAPSFAVVDALNDKLAKHGKLQSDGRPMLGLSCKELLSYVLEVNEALHLTDDITDPAYRQKPGAFIIPAHVWTPWFGLFGSKSGFDALEECFDELAPHVRAIETGLSSDIAMNWRISANDRLALVSFSDAHSAPNLLREATVVSTRERTYAAIAQALQTPTKTSPTGNVIDHTLEFFPQVGKYHYDGIAAQKLRLHPSETAKLDTELAKKVTVGVLSRVAELADRPEGYQPADRPGFVSVIPLHEIIANVLGVGKQSKKVQACYLPLVDRTSEYAILTKLTLPQLAKLMPTTIVEAILAVRNGKVIIEPGYDGLYGSIKIQKNQ